MVYNQIIQSFFTKMLIFYTNICIKQILLDRFF